MGIRIHKLLGYGLTDLKYDKKKNRPCDARLNLETFNNRYELGEQRRCDRLHYRQWLRKKLATCGSPDDYATTFELHCEIRHTDKRLSDNRERRRWYDPWDCIFHDGEYGLPNVLAIVPYTEREAWCRYDDMIDYMEEGKGSQGPRVQVYGDGLYPWIGRYWDARDGVCKDTAVACAYRRIMNAKPSRGSAGRTRRQLDAAAAQLAEVMQFASLAECKANLRPVVPTCIQLL